MKVTYTVPNGRLQFEFDATTPKDTFAQVASIQEVFEERECGKCGSESIRCDVREFKGNKYYKLLCNACGATLDFGQHKDAAQGLFAHRRVKDSRTRLPCGGWYRYGEDAGGTVQAGSGEELVTSTVSVAAGGTEPPADELPDVNDLAGLPAILAGNPDAANLNGLFPSLANFSPADKTAAWELIRVYAAGKGIKFDEAAKRFRTNGANGS